MKHVPSYERVVAYGRGSDRNGNISRLITTAVSALFAVCSCPVQSGTVRYSLVQSCLVIGTMNRYQSTKP
jgi:hypothetical protein